MKSGTIVLIIFIVNFLLSLIVALEFISLVSVYSVVVSFCIVLVVYSVLQNGEDVERLEKTLEEIRKRLDRLEQK